MGEMSGKMFAENFTVVYGDCLGNVRGEISGRFSWGMMVDSLLWVPGSPCKNTSLYVRRL